jgi:xylulose-5-phosphate/fructose-6-phosphate phosphoketolase
MSDEKLRKIHEYWCAANYLSVGQIYLFDNPLLKKKLTIEHIKPRLLGHFGTTPGLNFIYAHLNRVITQYQQRMLYICGPGHGGPGMVANAYLEGTYSEVYPAITQDEDGLKKLFTQFSFPGGIPSHVAPETPGSIHEGGELGYALSHAYGAAFDNPDLLVACVIGDGEAETGALATSWHSNKFLNPVHDGAVLPILHLNGYKIAGPTVLARIDKDELDCLLRGYGHTPYYVEGDDPHEMHQKMYDVLDRVIADIRLIQEKARTHGFTERPRWPMIVLRSPKGWTCPAIVDGKQVENSFRSHQVPLAELFEKPEHVEILEHWLQSYEPEKLFPHGTLRQDLQALAPSGEFRMSAVPCANGGKILQELELPDYRSYAVPIEKPGATLVESSRIQGMFLRDVLVCNKAQKNFRIFSPDETASNRLGSVFEVTSRMSAATILPTDDHVTPDGRVLEMLSEHQCQGWLEGYLLTGRHGVFSCYEAFIHIIDSMFNQHAKWLKTTREIPWRRPIASLNYLLSSHVWRQDHNGFSHQDPGFIDHVATKKAEVIRIYLPADANCLLSVTDHCLRSKHYVNVIVCGKQPALQWLTIEEAERHCQQGIGVWHWASNCGHQEPDLIVASAGDVPTLEALAAVKILREVLPALKIRFINVVDLMKLQSAPEHPHGLSEDAFDVLFTKNKPVIFAYHGYPTLIHRLTYKRANHDNFHVHGYKEEGTTTTPFDMVVLNQLDRFHLVLNALQRLPYSSEFDQIAKRMHAQLQAHTAYIRAHGIDMPEILHWSWS